MDAGVGESHEEEERDEVEDLYGSDEEDDLYGSSSPQALTGSASSSSAAGDASGGLRLVASSSDDVLFKTSAINSAVTAVLAWRDAKSEVDGRCDAAAAAASSSSSSSGAHTELRGHWTRARRAGAFHVCSTEEVWVAARALSAALARRFDIGAADARALLHHCKWDLSGAEAMLSDADRREVVAREAGMELFCPERPPFPEEGVECAVCYDTVEHHDQGHALQCGHWFCLDCWKGHCHEAIDSGLAMMRASCPGEGCPRLVDDDTLERFADLRDAKLMKTVVAKSMDGGKLACKCPGGDCDRHALFAGPSVLNVFCDCSSCFCFQCGQRGHGPCPCNLAIVFERKENWAKDPENGRLDASLKDKIKPW